MTAKKQWPIDDRDGFAPALLEFLRELGLIGTPKVQGCRGLVSRH